MDEIQLSNKDVNSKITSHNLVDEFSTDNPNIEIVNGKTTVDLKETNYRYLILIFQCFISFGCYFCYDTPGALQEQFLNDLEITASEFSIFYSLYSWPNVVLCFVGGYLLDAVFGLSLGTNLFCLINLIGQLIFAGGCYLKKIWLMQVGRFIFGIGGETITVAQSSYAGHWFKNKELNMVFGLQLSCARLGATANFLSMVPAYNYMTLIGYKGHLALSCTLFLASLSCVLSQFSSLILWYLDRKAVKINAARQTADKALKPSKGKSFRILDVKYFSLSYWLIVSICVTYYVTVFPFIGLGTLFFQRKYGQSRTDAARCDGLIYLISLFGSPLFGFIVDKVRNNQYFILIGLICTLTSHLLLSFTFASPYIAMTFMGLAFSFIACGLWPMVSYEVPEHLIGTAYGIMISVMNIGLAISSIVAGKIVDNYGYFILEAYFIFWLCISITLSLMLIMVKMQNNIVLKKVETEQEKYEHAELLTLKNKIK